MDLTGVTRVLDSRDFTWDEFNGDAVEDELVALAAEDNATIPCSLLLEPQQDMASPVLSLSMAEEFLICSQCHHPMDIQRCSPIFASSPRPRAPRRYTSTPCTTTSRTIPNNCWPREEFRKAELSYTGEAFSGVYTEQFGLHDTSPLLDRTADEAPSCLADGDDFDLSGEFVPDIWPEKLSGQLSTALCDSCSMSLGRRRELNLLSQKKTPGSRMSMYFPDRTGFDLADNLSSDVSGDGMSQSMNSEDSGACDVDVGLPSSSDECSSHQPETGSKRESCFRKVSQRLQTTNRSKINNDNKNNCNQTGSKQHSYIRDVNQMLKTPNKPSQVDIFKNNNINKNNSSQSESKQHSCIGDLGQRLQTPNMSINEHTSNNDKNNNNNSSYDIIHTPQTPFTPPRNIKSVQATVNKQQQTRPSPYKEQQPENNTEDLLGKVNDEKEEIETNETVEERLADVRRHLEGARKYYHELIEQWFWKNVIVLEKEREQLNLEQERRAEVQRAAMDTVSRFGKNSEESQTQNSDTSEGQDLIPVERCVDEHGLTGVVFITGRCERLTTEHLGAVLIQRCLDSKPVPRTLLPSKCLWSFDSRRGRTSDYMATGLSVTSSGDVIVTDTGLDMVTVFSKMGVKKLDINMTPGDHPTTAVEFNDAIAVACCSEVKLYDKVDGIYHRNQLARSLSRPQGVATDKHGHLVVSGYCIDIPAVAVYDKNTRLMNEMINGDNRCDLASEDTIGSELDETTNQVLFSKPWYVAADQSDQLLVSDRDSHTICVVNRRGELVEQIGSLGHKPGEFFHPAGICLDRQGCVIVADSQNHRIQVITPNQQTVLCLLDNEHDNIECPTDVALDKNGLLYVLQGSGVVNVYQYC